MAVTKSTKRKRCSKCGTPKLLTEFQKKGDTRDGLANHCKQCDREYRHSPHLRAAQHASVQRYRKRHAAAVRRREYARRRCRPHGLSLRDYERLLASQGGVCAICHGPETVLTPSGVPRYFAIDHDHATGRVRGLLCVRCNRLLGVARDSTERLRAAIAYLER